MDILPQLLVNAAIAGSIYALVSAGLCLTYGLLKILNFAHGHLMMVGVYAFYFASVEQAWSIGLSGFFTLGVMLVLALVSMKVFISPFMRFSPVLTFITTLSLATVLESVVSIIFGVNVKSLNQGFSINSIEIAGIYITPVQILIITSSLIILSLLASVTHHTCYGRKIKAVAEGADYAEALGVSRRKITGVLFSVTLILAAYACILIGYETNLQPTMGNLYTMKAFAAVVLGGLGNLWGAIVGSYILGLVENLSIGLDLGGWSIPAGYKDAISFIMILVVLLVRPQGLFGRAKRSV